MDNFAELVLTFLKNAIEKTYPTSALTESKADLQRQGWEPFTCNVYSNNACNLINL